MDIWGDPYKRRWIGWGVLSAAYILVGFHRASTAVIAEDLMRTFDTTGAGLGLLHSSFFYLYALLQLPAGLITDQLGARRTASMGTTAMSVGAVLFGVAPAYWVAFLGRVLMGLGASVLILCMFRYCANWFRPDEFATMTGLTISVGILGSIAATTPLAIAVAAVGWRPTLVALGGFGFVAALGVYLISYNTPESAGLDPIDNVPSTPTASLADLRVHTGTALRERETWVMGFMMFLSTGIGTTIFGLWGVPYLSQLYGITVTEASVYLLIGSVGSLIGAPSFGWLSDRLGRRTELVVLSTLSFTAAWAIIAAFGTPPLVIIAGVFFLSRVLRGGFTLIFTVMKETHSEDASATVTSIVNQIGWIGAAVFPPLIGALLDAFWTGETVAGARVYTEFGYRLGFLIATVAGLVTVGCALYLHVRIDRPGAADEEGAGAVAGGTD